MSNYKSIILTSFSLMLLSGFLRGYVDLFDGQLTDFVSSTAGWLGAFFLGYASPEYRPRHFWFFAAGGIGIIGFWVAGYWVFNLIAYSY
ncbi:MAG: hypothetical protein LCH81_03725 [Bacteroidetes bacterium]|nr:hypothetical protein [Bacteroidota bacterium]